MAYNEDLADSLRELLSDHPGIVEKKMFGGLAFILNGNMCVGIRDEGLIIRFDKSEQDSMMENDKLEPFSPAGRVMRGWAWVLPEALESADELRAWVNRSLKFAGRLPKK